MTRIYKVTGPTSNKKAKPVVEIKDKTAAETPEEPTKPTKTTKKPKK